MAKKLPKKPKKFIDSDKDGLSDWEEINIYGSDPYDDDTDGDGVEDGEQVLQGRHPVTGEKLKDFFIPSARNNYQPKSLNPKRVLFHAVGALLIKLIIILFIISYPISAWMAPDFIVEQNKKIIALTNQLRQSLQIKELTESGKLNQAAYSKVQDMFLNQYFAHTSPDKKNLESFLKQVGYNFAISGENLAVGFSDANEVIEAWKNSPTHYSNLIDSDFSEIGVNMAEGLFKGVDTIFIAQYFALPNEAEVLARPIVKTETAVKTPVKIESGAKAVLSAKEDAEDLPINNTADFLSTTTPVKNDSVVSSEVIIDHPEKQEEILVKVVANLKPEIVAASAQVMDSNIDLVKNENNSWEGQQIIYDKNVIVPALITTIDNNGISRVAEIKTDNIEPKQTSVAEKYFLLRNNPNNSIEKILDISLTYYKVILVLAILSLLLNIFIQIKKQRPKLIFSGIGIIVLLIILIIF